MSNNLAHQLCACVLIPGTNTSEHDLRYSANWDGNAEDDARNRAAWASLIGQAPNTDVCWDIDISRWKAMLYDALR